MRRFVQGKGNRAVRYLPVLLRALTSMLNKIYREAENLKTVNVQHRKNNKYVVVM